MPVFETGTFNHSVTCPHHQRGEWTLVVEFLFLSRRMAGTDSGLLAFALSGCLLRSQSKTPACVLSVTCLHSKCRDIARIFTRVEQNIGVG